MMVWKLLVATCVVSILSEASGFPDSFGTEFVFAFPLNIYGGLPQVLVTTLVQETVQITVSVPGINYMSIINVSRDQSATIELPEEAAITERAAILTNKTIIVKSTNFVSVHAIYGIHVSSDGSLIHPTHLLQKDYVEIGSQCQAYSVSAIENDTVVNIPIDHTGRDRQDITLLQFESYHYYAQQCTPSTRSFIYADKPVSFTSVTPCGGLRASTDSSPGTNTCDYLMQHMPPRTQGHFYVLGPFLGRQSGFVFHIIGTETETAQVTISDGNVINVAKGEFYQGEVPGDGVVTVTADRPVLVVQFTKPHDIDMVGDSFMVALPPTESYSNNISFPVAIVKNHYNGQIPQQLSYISIIAKCTDAGSFYLDDQLLNTEDNPILQTSDGDFCILRTPVTSGGHRVTHPNSKTRFLVLVYGFGTSTAVGYGYIAGYGEQLELPADKEEESSTDSLDTVTTKTLTSQLLATGVSSIRPTTRSSKDGCPPFETSNGVLNPAKDWYTPGDIVTVFCRQGFDVVGDATLICSSTRTWHGEIPECSVNIQGDGPPDNPNTTGTISPIVIGSATGGFIIVIVIVVVAIVFYCKSKKNSKPSESYYSTSIPTVTEPNKDGEYEIPLANPVYESLEERVPSNYDQGLYIEVLE